MTLYDQAMEATAYVQSRSALKPDVGIILGSGLGDLAAGRVDRSRRSGVPGRAVLDEHAFQEGERCLALEPAALFSPLLAP